MNTASNKTDESLMSQLAQGELDAAAVLFRRYKVRLFNFFLRSGFARESAEDLVQTVFERIIKYRLSYRPEMAFRAWLYQIARHAQTDFKKRRLRLVEDDFSDAPLLNGYCENAVHQAIEQEEDFIQLEKALNRLPEEQREVLLLTRYEGLKYAETGALLGCSEGAVKLKVFRALQQLRSIFFKMEQW
jgi:RNA polymerase sigma factor (sigma-70 family)